MSRATLLLSVFVVVGVVLENAWGAHQQQQSDRSEELSDLKLLVPLLGVEDDDEVPESEAWRAGGQSDSSEEDAESVKVALAKLLEQLSGKAQKPQTTTARPRVYNLAHDHSEHAGKPCPVCLFLNALMQASQQNQGSNNRLTNRNQQRGNTRVKPGKQRGFKRGQQRAREDQAQEQHTCTVQVIDLDDGRRSNDPQDVGPQDGAPRDKPPAP